MWLLHRVWVLLDALYAGETPVEVRLLLRPERADGLDVIVHARAALFVRHADDFELPGHVTHPDAEDEPAVGQHIDAGERFGQHHGVALRQQDDAGAELQRGGVGCRERQRDHGVEHGQLRRHRRGRFLRVDHHHVLAGPGRLETGILQPAHQVGDVLGRCRRAVVETEVADFHGGSAPVEIRKRSRECKTLSCLLQRRLEGWRSWVIG